MCKKYECEITSEAAKQCLAGKISSEEYYEKMWKEAEREVRTMVRITKRTLEYGSLKKSHHK